MLIVANVILGVLAAILCMGLICESDKAKGRNLTIAFVAVLTFIAVTNLVFK